MARPLRIAFPDATYHITARGNRRESIFFKDRDRFVFLSKLNETIEKFSLVCYAYCLMPNHYHLFLRTPKPNLSESLHYLNCSYSNWLKTKYNLIGVVFQGRFKSILVEEERYALALSVYIHLNPCRWKIVPKPEDYPWSSCRDYLGMRRPQVRSLDPSRVLRYFGETDRSARDAYGSLLIERMGMENPLKNSYRGIALGSDTYIDRIRGLINARSVSREHPAHLRDSISIYPISTEQILSSMSAIVKLPIAEIRAKKRDRPYRPMGIYLMKKHCAAGLKEIGEIWGMDYGAVTMSARRFGQTLNKHPDLRSLVKRIEAGFSLDSAEKTAVFCPENAQKGSEIKGKRRNVIC